MTDQANQRQALLRRLASLDQGDLLERLCLLAIEQVPCDGAAVMVTAAGLLAGRLASAGDSARRAAEAEFDLGEGPSFEVLRSDRPVLIDHVTKASSARWPVLGERLLEADIASIFAFPLRLGAIRLGVVQISRLAPSPLSDSSYATARIIVDLMTDAVLFLQAGLVHADVDDLLSSAGADRLRVHQATGMVAELLACPIPDALARMRARAYAEGVPLLDLADRVIEGEAVFSHDD